jgi:hypothetical protein
LILDFALLVGIWTFILDDLEELFDAHLGVGCRSVSFGIFGTAEDEDAKR